MIGICFEFRESYLFYKVSDFASVWLDLYDFSGFASRSGQDFVDGKVPQSPGQVDDLSRHVAFLLDSLRHGDIDSKLLAS